MKYDTVKCLDNASPDREAAAQADVFGRIRTILICWNCGEELWADSGERFVTCSHCGSLLNAAAALR